MWLFTQAYIYDSKADIEPSCVGAIFVAGCMYATHTLEAVHGIDSLGTPLVPPCDCFAACSLRCSTRGDPTTPCPFAPSTGSQTLGTLKLGLQDYPSSGSYPCGMLAP